MDAGLVGLLDVLLAVVRREHGHVMPGGPQMSHRALPHELVAAEVVGRVHVADAQNAHGDSVDLA